MGINQCLQKNFPVWSVYSRFLYAYQQLQIVWKHDTGIWAEKKTLTIQIYFKCLHYSKEEKKPSVSIGYLYNEEKMKNKTRGQEYNYNYNCCN